MKSTLDKLIFTPGSDFMGSNAELNAIIESETILNKQKVRELKNKNNETLEEQLTRLRKKFKKDENLYETYDPAKFELKARIDLLFFEHVCQNLPDVEKMPELIGSYYRTVKNLYETVNMLPENHRMLSTSVLNESYDNQQKIFSKILSEHINNNYYRYSKEQRREKFLNETQEYAHMLVEKGLESDGAIQIAIKANLLESLIGNIAIPKFVQRRIRTLCEDEDYGKVFDQQHLKNLWEKFQVQTKNVSRILAAAV